MAPESLNEDQVPTKEDYLFMLGRLSHRVQILSEKVSEEDRSTRFTNVERLNVYVHRLISLRNEYLESFGDQN